MLSCVVPVRYSQYIIADCSLVLTLQYLLGMLRYRYIRNGRFQSPHFLQFHYFRPHCSRVLTPLEVWHYPFR